MWKLTVFEKGASRLIRNCVKHVLGTERETHTHTHRARAQDCNIAMIICLVISCFNDFFAFFVRGQCG